MHNFSTFDSYLKYGSLLEFKQCGIYRIICVETGNAYIGASIDMGARLFSHYQRLINGTHNTSFQQDFDKFGIDRFEVDILQLCQPESRLHVESSILLDLNPVYNILGVKNPDIATKEQPVKINKTARKTNRDVSRMVAVMSTPQKRIQISQHFKSYWASRRKTQH